MEKARKVEVSDRSCAMIWGYLWLQLLLVATGVALLFVYRGASAVESAGSFRTAQEVWIWRFLAGFHYWGTFLSLVTGPLLLAHLFLQGFTEKVRKLWVPLLLAVLIPLALQITGNALPADRHDIRTINVEASIASRAPLIGANLGRIALQGDEFSTATLDFWKTLHIGLGVGSLVPLVCLYAALRRRRPKSGFEILASISLPVFAVAAAMLVPRATGSEFQPIDQSSFVAQPSWYVLPMHAMLKMFESIHGSLGWVGAMLVPGLGTMLAFLAPWWAPKLSASARRGILLSIIAGVGLVMVFFGAPAAPISGMQPVHEIAAGKDGGPIVESLSAKGAKIYEDNCSGCHGKGGAGSPGAPKLTEVHRQNTDPQFYIRFLRDPKSVNPSSTMPSFSHLSDDDLRALAEWLRDPERP